MPTAGTQAAGLYRPNTMGAVQHTAAARPAQEAPPPVPRPTTPGQQFNLEGTIGDYYGWREPVSGKWKPPKRAMPTDPAARKYLEDFRRMVYGAVFGRR